MDPRTLTAIRRKVNAELASIREAWPAAEVTLAGTGIRATVIIPDGRSTYIIRVDSNTATGEVTTRSLCVKHYGTAHPPEWRDGWVD